MIDGQANYTEYILFSELFSVLCWCHLCSSFKQANEVIHILYPTFKGYILNLHIGIGQKMQRIVQPTLIDIVGQGTATFFFKQGRQVAWCDI